jgi:hypothetical protein
MGYCFKIVSLIFFFTTQNGLGQSIRLRVLDSTSNVALPYVSIANENTQEGWLANADGFVTLPCDSIAEFTFTYIGYTTVKINCQALIGNKHQMDCSLDKLIKASPILREVSRKSELN